MEGSFLRVGGQQYDDELRRHYAATWGVEGATHSFNRGRPFHQKCEFVECPPTPTRNYFVYATCGMTPLSHTELLELFILSPYQSDSLFELLASVAHFHQTGTRLGHHHTVNFGRPWLNGSRCNFGFISKPYLHGPELEVTYIGGAHVDVLWLIPITPEERDYKIAAGVAALEDLFEARSFNYLDPMRLSVV